MLTTVNDSMQHLGEEKNMTFRIPFGGNADFVRRSVGSCDSFSSCYGSPTLYEGDQIPSEFWVEEQRLVPP